MDKEVFDYLNFIFADNRVVELVLVLKGIFFILFVFLTIFTVKIIIDFIRYVFHDYLNF